jgi:hypothetical protein
MRFVVPQCFAAPQNFERTVGLRLGLLGIYRDGGISATEIFARGIKSSAGRGANVVIVVVD